MATISTQHLWAWLVVVTCSWGWGWGLKTMYDFGQYVGIGYNLLTGNPDGGLARVGGVDPGLLVTRRIIELGDRSQSLVMMQRTSCAETETISTYYGAKSYQDKLSLGVELDGSFNPVIAAVKFGLNAEFLRTQNETAKHHKVIQEAQKVCNHGQARLSNDYIYRLRVTGDFAASVCMLPPEYQLEDYMHFLDRWGTHMTKQVDVGQKTIDRSVSNWAEFVQHIEKTSGGDISLGGSLLGYGASLQVNVESFKSRENFEQLFGSKSEHLQMGTEDMPEPIKVVLFDIDNVFHPNLWDFSSFSHSPCWHDIDVEAMGHNIRRALSEYVAYKMVTPPEDPKLVVPLTWPRGSYGLPKSITGCPRDIEPWEQGARLFDLHHLFGERNILSPEIHLAGLWTVDGDIEMDFCIKGYPSSEIYAVDWPAGDYCVFKYGECPKGFQSGFLQWNDDDFYNKDKKNGTLPDGTYDDNTKIQFCCRHDGLPTKPIFLPIDTDFYLLRHTRGCQKVHHTVMVEETVQWDESYNYLGLAFSEDERQGGAHPYDDGKKDNHRLHFCHYLPTNKKERSLCDQLTD